MTRLRFGRLFGLLLAIAAIGACDRSPTRDASVQPGVSAAKATTAATPTPAPAPAGKTFGAGVKLTETTAIDAILAEPAKFHGKTVRVEGMITDVCPKRGCWLELAGSGAGQKLRFKVTDGEMVFPMDAKGQRATAEGIVAVRELSIEESKQHAEYQAKEYGIAYDPASITKPTSVVRIDGTGAVLQ
ncbi:MAG: DUF4920 domain-containing protein [Deltaproteobacteria bacterium]|nr:DUF4920 domain-containing protein [Deltaproteobacteria bacterium]MDQ3297319.1 DUF4920 domain-containing protein [Myxococcota bacterium]